MRLLSELYNVTLKRDYRGITAEGYVRPTVTQFYTCNKPFYLIQSRANITVRPNIGEDIIFNDKIQLSEAGEYTVTTDKEVNVYCKLWGAGGGPLYSLTNESPGGMGGYTYGEILLQPNTMYKIWVGGGGKVNIVDNSIGIEGGFGGGGFCGHSAWSNRWTSSGGGLTGVFLDEVTHTNSILIAGGGGGQSSGGNGGGLTGGEGRTLNKDPGNGGTQTAGGAPGSNSYRGIRGTAGSKLQGGNGAPRITDSYSGGGGGGGYYGGGGGSGNNPQGSQGGGGSGFIHPNLITNGQTVRLNNNGGPVPNNTDPDYINGAGDSPTDAYVGNDGLFVISIIN